MPRAACSLSPPGVMMEGWLETSEADGPGVWLRRYFRLDLDCEPTTLAWSTSPEPGSQQGDQTVALVLGTCVGSVQDHHAHV